MNQLHTTTLLCPVMIGRDQPLALLANSLNPAREGNPPTLLISGEAGIGKSRFVAEAKAQAASQGAQTLQGNCFEPDRTLPYAPLIDLLRDLAASSTSDEISDLAGPAAPDLVKLSPEVAARLPTVAPAPPTSPEQEKQRLFHALAQTLARSAHPQPLLLIIEDIHWSDDNSLGFLLFFARQAPTLRISLLLTFRSDEIHDGLRHFLATLLRLRLATEVELERLNAGELDAMLQAMFALSQPVKAEFLHRLYGLSDGNPFFTEEIINALIATGDIVFTDGRWDRKPLHEIRLPRTIHDAVVRRSDQLSAQAADLLAMAAVAGRRFDITLLASLTGHDEGQMIGLIKELIRAQLVVEESADQFAFRHALTQQVIYGGLLARERVALHRAIAYQIERTFATTLNAHVAELARHFYEAGEWSKALEYARLAGARARALYAPRAAIEQLTRALGAAQQLGLPTPQGLLRERGQEYETLGEFTLAQADFEGALAQAAAEGDRKAEWQALVGLGMLWAGRDYQQTGEYYRQALALAERMGDQTLLGRSLNRMGNWYVNHEEPIQAQHCHHQALTILEAIDDQAGVAETCDYLGMAYLLSADLHQCAAYTQRAIELYRPTNQQPGLSSTLATLSISVVAYQCRLLTPASLPSAPQRYGEEAIRIAQTIGHRAGEAYALFALGCVLGPQGKWSEALELLHRSYAIAEEIEHRQWMCATLTALNTVFDDLLDFESAHRYGEQALAMATAIGSAHWIHSAAGFLASTCARQGDFAQAVSILHATGWPGLHVVTLGEHLVAQGGIELLLAQGDCAAALATVESLIGNLPNASTDHQAPKLLLLHGQALAGVGRTTEAEARFLAGVAAAQTWNDQATLRALYVGLANLYQQAHRHDELAWAVREGTALTQRLAEAITDPTQRSTFTARAIAALPPMPARTAHQTAPQQPGGLTAREREVARAIMQGQSNKAIAAHLIVSERTVESHVSNILSKLGFTTRTQIATWAVEQGLRQGD